MYPLRCLQRTGVTLWWCICMCVCVCVYLCVCAASPEGPPASFCRRLQVSYLIVLVFTPKASYIVQTNRCRARDSFWGIPCYYTFPVQDRRPEVWKVASTPTTRVLKDTGSILAMLLCCFVFYLQSSARKTPFVRGRNSMKVGGQREGGRKGGREGWSQCAIKVQGVYRTRSNCASSMTQDLRLFQKNGDVRVINMGYPHSKWRSGHFPPNTWMKSLVWYSVYMARI